MLRIALIDIFMFSLPFLIYGAYMIAAKGVAPADVWQGAPFLWLIVAGCGLLADHHGGCDPVLGRQARRHLSSAELRGWGHQARHDRLSGRELE